jgi:hypothetical protein
MVIIVGKVDLFSLLPRKERGGRRGIAQKRARQKNNHIQKHQTQTTTPT